MNLNEAEPRTRPRLLSVALAAAVMVLPSAHRELGWLAIMIPLPVFYYLVLYGLKKGGLVIAGAVVTAAAIAALFGSLAYYLFSLTLAPVGLILAQGALRRESVLRAGGKSILLLAGLWVLFVVSQGLGSQTNFYKEMLEGIDRGFEAALVFYRDSGRFSPDAIREIEGFLERFRLFIGKVLPALILSSIICSVWLNILTGQWLLKKSRGAAPWQDLGEWRLPEVLVWPVILAGTALVLPWKAGNTIGLNLGIVLGLAYFTQGIAILSHFMKKWSVPTALRVIIYLMLLLQMYGLVLLAGIGLTDVWADFRKKTAAAPPDES